MKKSPELRELFRLLVPTIPHQHLFPAKDKPTYVTDVQKMPQSGAKRLRQLLVNKYDFLHFINESSLRTRTSIRSGELPSDIELVVWDLVSLLKVSYSEKEIKNLFSTEILRFLSQGGVPTPYFAETSFLEVDGSSEVITWAYVMSLIDPTIALYILRSDQKTVGHIYMENETLDKISLSAKLKHTNGKLKKTI